MTCTVHIFIYFMSSRQAKFDRERRSSCLADLQLLHCDQCTRQKLTLLDPEDECTLIFRHAGDYILTTNFDALIIIYS